MKFFDSKKFIAGAAVIAAFCCPSCVKTDGTLGQEFIPDSDIWQVGITSFDLESIEMQKASELGGYNSRRISIGGVNDPEMGWSEREAAFALIPIADTTDALDLGENIEFRQFHFALAKDTVSFRDASQENIIQNIRVYELKKPLDENYIYAGQSSADLYDEAAGVVTEGIPTYNGGDSLSFNFSAEFGQKYLEALSGMPLDSVSAYIKRLPGILIKADRPTYGSGRINMFDVAVDVNDYNYITGNYVELKYRAKFDDRGVIDTSLVFMVGAAEFVAEDSSTLPTQYGFNFSSSEGKIAPSASSTENIYIEGGSGLKPVLRAQELKEEVTKAISAKIEGYDSMSDSLKKVALSKVVINKATIKLPFEASGDFSALDYYPETLSPTCRLQGKSVTTSGDTLSVVSYAGLTDASVSSENQGTINRSTLCYEPDVSHHIQELLRLSKKDSESDEDFAKRESQYDIWMLIMHDEVDETSSSSSSSSYNDYLSALAYSSYYNSLYNGYGYGSYGYGYGSYGYNSYYNNYYNYMMMAAYASSSSSSTTSTSTELDKDRYYSCKLYGPASTEKKPTMTITFSYPKE